MTDNRMADLLALFREIEILMVQNGAKETKENGKYTTYKEKISGFDTFDFEPKNPGNVGYKFYEEENKYYIKEAYRYDVNIKEQLKIYENYKLHEIRYKEYRETILGGNYYVLQHIGYERNKLLYIENYEIEDHKLFVKDCKSMIKYLKNPDKKLFLSYSKFSDGAKNRLVTFKEKSLLSQNYMGLFLKGLFFLAVLLAGIFGVKYINEQEVSTLADPTIGHYIWASIFAAIAAYFLYKVFTFFTNKWVLRGLLFLASLLGLTYLGSQGAVPFFKSDYSFSIAEYLLGGGLIATGLYYFSSILKLLTHGWMTTLLLLGAALFGFQYLSNDRTLPTYASEYFSKHNFSINEIVLGGAFLLILLYLLPRILGFLSTIFTALFQGLNHFIGDFFTGIFSFFFTKEGMGKPLGSMIPYIFGLFLIYFFWDGMGKNSFPQTVHKPKVVSSPIKKCQYYYVHVDTLHLRKKPTDQSSIIGEVHKNKKLCITQKGKAWYYVYRKGWVYRQHIRRYDNRLGQTVY